MIKHTFIIAKITPKAECFNMAKEAIEKITPQTRNESGCLIFILHTDGEGCLYLYEEWIDEKALQDHHAMDYTQSVFESYKSWLSAPPEITKLEKLT
jgi:quinol monooxygenase YgiN